jgi:hypothetical protein
LQSALDRVHYDHNLMTYSRFDSTATLDSGTRQISLYQSRYKILILPPVEIIPYPVLRKVKEFYDMGGTVIGWQRVPTRSARFGETDGEIAGLSAAIWNSATPQEGVLPVNTNASGGGHPGNLASRDNGNYRTGIYSTPLRRNRSLAGHSGQ